MIYLKKSTKVVKVGGNVSIATNQGLPVRELRNRTRASGKGAATSLSNAVLYGLLSSVLWNVSYLLDRLVAWDKQTDETHEEETIGKAKDLLRRRQLGQGINSCPAWQLCLLHHWLQYV